MASKAKLSVVASTIKEAVLSAEATAIAVALIDLRSSEDAFDRINQALAKAKEAKLPWGDARKPKEGGLVLDIRAGLKAKIEAEKRTITPASFDNAISLIGWCYKSGNRLQTLEAKVQQGKVWPRPQGKQLKDFKVIFPDQAGSAITFSAFVVGFEPEGPVAGKLTAKLKLRISGLVVMP